MTRPPLLALALALAALVLAAPAAAAPSAEPGDVRIDFDLPANHGLKASVSTAAGLVSLQVSTADETDVVTYSVRGEVTETGLKARFGKLGSIDLAFTPTRTVRGPEPPKGCLGEPSTYQKGAFAGTIEFRGERDYVRVRASRAKGRLDVSREAEWKCPGRKRPYSSRLGPAGSDPKGRPAREEDASIVATGGRCGCIFGAFTAEDRRGHEAVLFIGVRRENREGMHIERVAYAKGGPSSFEFDHRAGTASLQPPKPFTGSATFKRRPGRRALWQSTIQVSLLGGSSASFRGRAFAAKLGRGLFE